MRLWLLVIAQVLLSAALVLSANWWPVRWGVLALASPGIALAVWAWSRIGLRKIRIHPATTTETQLSTEGPYRIVRHPMYTGLLWLVAVLLVDPLRWWRFVAWLALLLVLHVKCIFEERSLCSRFADYKAYQCKVGRLLPRLISHRS